MKAYFSNIEDLEEWFKAKDCAHWILYYGHVYRGGSGHRTAEQKEDISLEDSWELLERMIKAQSGSGGDFTIYVPNKSRNQGDRAFYKDSQGLANSKGIGMPAEYVNKQVEQYKREIDLKNTIEGLEADLHEKEKPNPLNRIAEKFLEHPNFDKMLEMLIVGISGKLAGVEPSQMNNHTQEEGEVQGERQPDVQKIEQGLMRINQVFPDIENFITGVANFVENNPDTAKQIVSKWSSEEQQTEQ